MLQLPQSLGGKILRHIFYDTFTEFSLNIKLQLSTVVVALIMDPPLKNVASRSHILSSLLYQWSLCLPNTQLAIESSCQGLIIGNMTKV